MPEMSPGSTWLLETEERPRRKGRMFFRDLSVPLEPEVSLEDVDLRGLGLHWRTFEETTPPSMRTLIPRMGGWMVSVARPGAPTARIAEFEEVTGKSWRNVRTRELTSAVGRRLAAAESLWTDPIQEVEELLASASWIRDLDQDWDGEGAVAVSGDTWETMATLLRNQCVLALESARHLKLPTISPAQEGSLDLYWPGNTRRLLLNVPVPAKGRPTFYGEDDSGDVISGTMAGANTDIDLTFWIVGIDE